MAREVDFLDEYGQEISTALGFNPTSNSTKPLCKFPIPLLLRNCPSSTFLPCRAKPMPRLTAVVVLPTPPFWLARAMIFDIFIPPQYAYLLCFMGYK